MNSICSQGDTSLENVSFIKDIQMMMFGLGDSSQPLHSTATIVEKVVLQQLILIIGQAEEVSEKRGMDGIYPQDILFLMRKDRAKLKRIIQYVSLKEAKNSLLNISNGDSNPMNVEELTDDKGLIEGKKKTMCLQFLQSLGVEIGQEEDPRIERLRRMDQRVQNMSMKTFYEYQQSMQKAFVGRNGANRFLDWLKQNCPEISTAITKLKLFSVDMMLYLAKETVAQLVDLALLLRQDAGVCPTDPLSRAVPPPFCDVFPPPTQRLVEGPPPITADEVREVLRRFYSPQINPCSPFTCNVDSTIFNKIMTFS